MCEKINEKVSHVNELNEELIKKSSMIFQGEQKLTDYQKRINDAGYSLCQGNPTLLLGKKGDLLELARAKVHEDGYNYKKGHSRSKKHQSMVEGSEPAVKRAKVNAEERQRRLAELTEEISELSKRITFKERRIEEATLSHSFRVCDDLASEVSELKARRRELTAELAKFQQNAKKATYYARRKQTHQTEDADVNDAEDAVGEDESESF